MSLEGTKRGWHCDLGTKGRGAPVSCQPGRLVSQQKPEKWLVLRRAVGTCQIDVELRWAVRRESGMCGQPPCSRLG